MDLSVVVHHEDSSYWAEVKELPGCFASGDNFDELVESLKEAIQLYLAEDPDAPAVVEVSELRVATSASEPQPA
jgi:predicted RNase H-like HicB family nuclease